MCVCVEGKGEVDWELLKQNNSWYVSPTADFVSCICWPVLTGKLLEISRNQRAPWSASTHTKRVCATLAGCSAQRQRRRCWGKQGLWRSSKMPGSSPDAALETCSRNKHMNHHLYSAVRSAHHWKPAAETNTWTIIFTVQFIQLTTGNLQQKQTHEPSSLQCSSFSSPLETCSRNKQMNCLRDQGTQPLQGQGRTSWQSWRTMNLNLLFHHIQLTWLEPFPGAFQRKNNNKNKQHNTQQSLKVI